MYKVFDNIHMMCWMGRPIHHHATTTASDDHDLRMQLKSWEVSRHLTIYIIQMVQTADPHGMVPTSILNITIVSDNIHAR